MTTFHLIRHAEREGDQQRLVGRTEGLRLSASGRRQALRLAKRLASVPLRRVYSSPMERAQETAEPLARERGVAVEISPALTEVDFGEWTGWTMTELAGDERWERFNAFRSGTAARGGEAFVEVQARVVAELLRLREVCRDEAIAVVSHGDPIRAALAYFLGTPLDLILRMEIGLASVSVVKLDERGAVVARVNDTMEGEDA